MINSSYSKRGWLVNAWRAGLLAIFCGVFTTSANAIDDISERLVLNCTNQLKGTFTDSTLDVVRGGKYPLPKTGGFRVSSAERFWLTPGLAPYCLVKGTILPTSPNGKDPAVKSPDYIVPDINYQIYIPSQWNGKLIQLGGGGFAWSADVMSSVLLPTTQFSTSLANYALLISDAGVSDMAKVFTPDFVQAGNKISDIPQQEMVKNFGQDSIKKSLDVALHVTTTLAGKKPADIYFVGLSTGGRQALKAMANWPDSYDGVISGAPPAYETELLRGFVIPSVYDSIIANYNKPIDAFKVLYGVDLSTESMREFLKGVSTTLTTAAVMSGEANDSYNKILNVLMPVWNVTPSDLSKYLDATELLKRTGNKGKKIILYQGTSDYLVNCRQSGRFVRELAEVAQSKNMTPDSIRNSVRTFFVEDYSHGFYTATSTPKTGGVWLNMQLMWGAISELDNWVHNGNASVQGPLLSRNPSGAIPSVQDLSSWNCLATP